MSELPVRPPAVAGQFYPGDRDVLRRIVQQYMADATLPEDLGTVRAVVAPHAGYVYSGPVAAAGTMRATGAPSTGLTAASIWSIICASASGSSGYQEPATAERRTRPGAMVGVAITVGSGATASGPGTVGVAVFAVQAERRSTAKSMIHCRFKV